jgi:serine phosphatase RsbU (regulator of sigma subunit)
MMVDIKDMLLAGAVQQCLIPSGEYKIEGYDCVIYNQMAIDVGGDYADIFELPEDKYLIVIGDVTGHGISSALLTAMVKASIYGFAKENTELKEIVTYTSKMISDLLNKKKLMTFCAITLDRNSGEMAICNAGHPYPIIREKEIGSIRTPSITGFPMGASKRRCKYTTESELLKPEETLFLYTDGFPEAENNKGEIYGYNNFQQLIANSEITSTEALRDSLLKVFKDFHGEAELADDITFIILRRKPL